MGQAEFRSDQSTRLDQAILYLLISEAEERPDGYKIPISKVHDVLFEISDELEHELGVSLKFNRNGPQIHSPQVEDALNDIVPYSIPVRNPSFSLEVSKDVAEVISTNIKEQIPDEQKSRLDSLSEDPGYREVLNKTTQSL